MPRRLWLPNVEEALPENDPLYASVCVPKTLELTPRFLPCLERGDAIVSPREIDGTFAVYMAGLSGLGAPAKWLFTVSQRSQPYSLVDSLLADKPALARLRALGRAGGWTLEPYLQTPRVLRLSRETGLPLEKTHPSLVKLGAITRLNDKGRFKELAQGLGVKTPGGYLVESMPALEKAIDLVSRSGSGRVMLRKTYSGGGLGNLSGSREELLRGIQGWYSGGRILVEPFLDITSVAGSLADINPRGVEFRGVDVQTFRDGKWTGFDFPHPDKAAAAEIKRLALLTAWAVRAGGARGHQNIDWALTASRPGVPLALECNFRQNGFGFVLDFACRYFGAGPESLFIRYREGVPCGHTGTAALLGRLERMKVRGEQLLLERPGQRGGAALMSPPLRGQCSLGVFARDPEYLREAAAALAEAGL